MAGREVRVYVFSRHQELVAASLLPFLASMLSSCVNSEAFGRGYIKHGEIVFRDVLLTDGKRIPISQPVGMCGPWLVWALIEDFVQGLGIGHLDRPFFQLIDIGGGQPDRDGIEEPAKATRELWRLMSEASPSCRPSCWPCSIPKRSAQMT